MKIEAVRVFAISKLGWIKKQRSKLQAQERESPREYLERESHYLWGNRYLLRINEGGAPRGPFRPIARSSSLSPTVHRPTSVGTFLRRGTAPK
jgi:predicted metal-dependent hydrolase